MTPAEDSWLRCRQLIGLLDNLRKQTLWSDDYRYHDDLYRETVAVFWPFLSDRDRVLVRTEREETRPPVRLMPNPSMVLGAA